MLEPAQLAHVNDTPYSTAYDDIYHSAAGGLEQARHVFLSGNDLPRRWQGRQRFVVAETGFGLGLNFLAVWQAWRDDPARCDRLHFVSFEKHPLSRGDLAIAHRWPRLREVSESLLARWPLLVPGVHRLNLDDGHVTLTLFFGDATELVSELRARVDAFFLDGFNPIKNPDLWAPALLTTLSRSAAPQATLATWCVAAQVRAALAQCGWRLVKRPGFPPKRDMLVGHRRGNAVTDINKGQHCKREAVIIGAGLAGTSCAERLAARGWDIKLIERAHGPAEGASGNRVGVLRPQPSVDDNYLARITRAGFLYARAHLQGLTAGGLPVAWHACGALQLARDPEHEERQRRFVARANLDPDYLRFVDRKVATRLARWPVACGGWWFPQAGWVDPTSLCAANLERYRERIETFFGRTAARIEYQPNGWCVIDEAGVKIAQAPVLILANAFDACRLISEVALPLRTARGQVNYLPSHETGRQAAPRVVVCRHGYVTPPVAGTCRVGASFVLDDEDRTLRLAESKENVSRLESALPGYAPGIEPATIPGRVALRAMSLDRLPLVGALPEARPRLTAAAGAVALANFPRQQGLFGVLGLGARGLVWASLAAELLAAELEDEPMPLESRLADALDPARFALRQMRRDA